MELSNYVGKTRTKRGQTPKGFLLFMLYCRLLLYLSFGGMRVWEYANNLCRSVIWDVEDFYDAVAGCV